MLQRRWNGVPSPPLLSSLLMIVVIPWFTTLANAGGSSCSFTDNYPSHCPGWKNPYCTSWLWVNWMATNCAKTCKCSEFSDLPIFNIYGHNLQITFPNQAVETIRLTSTDKDRCIFGGETYQGQTNVIVTSSSNENCLEHKKKKEIAIQSKHLEKKTGVFHFENGVTKKVDDRIFIIDEGRRKSTGVTAPKSIKIPINLGVDQAVYNKMGKFASINLLQKMWFYNKLKLKFISHHTEIELVLNEIFAVPEAFLMTKEDLKKSRKYQKDEKIPTVILIKDDPNEDVKGLTFRSGACRKDKGRYGVTLVASKATCFLTGETMIHELGHLFGGVHNDVHDGTIHEMRYNEFNSDNINHWFGTKGKRCFAPDCSPAADSWNGDCSRYKWACTDSRYPWYKAVCSTTCKHCASVATSGTSATTLQFQQGTTLPKECDGEYAYKRKYTGGQVVSVPNGGSCHSVCETHPSCITWTWDSVNRKCRIQKAASNLQDSSDYVSGTKNSCKPNCYWKPKDNEAETSAEYCTDENNCSPILRMEPDDFEKNDDILVCYKVEGRAVCEPIDYDKAKFTCNQEPADVILSSHRNVGKKSVSFRDSGSMFAKWG